VKLRDFFQRDVRADAQDTLQGLLRAVLMRAQFVPGARRALGWRGLKQSVASTGEGWTARIDGHAGVFGVCFNGFKEEKGWVVGSFGLSYFPDADEAMVECCSLRAAAYSQRPDYMSLVRDFLQNEELMPLFPSAHYSSPSIPGNRHCISAWKARPHSAALPKTAFASPVIKAWYGR